MKRLLKIAAGLAAIASLTAGVQGYATASYKWASAPVPVYVNPNNQDVSTSAAISAVQAGMNAWNNGGTWFRFSYAGQVSDTSTATDGRNVVIFRNVSNPDNPNAIATTYSWSMNGSRYDSDVVFWDGAFKLFTGSSGCASGAYIEDIATHELGHSLGLVHSSVADATMYPTYSMCSTALRSLASDDLAGLQSLYAASQPAPNTAPTVTISTPLTGASYLQGTSVLLTGIATDVEDGSLTTQLSWSSSRDGALGLGGSLSKTLSAGTHTITAKATDTGSLSTTKSVSVTITVPTTPTTGATLNAKGYKVKGTAMTDLSWSNLSATTVDVYRNNVKVSSVPNTGLATDKIGKGGGSFGYKVCAAGTSTCSNAVTVTF